MGLDNIAAIRKTVSSDDISTECEYITMSKEVFKDVPNCLVGGTLSGHGQGPTIRGKVYDSFTSYITGVSLYQETIAEDVVKKMAARLRFFLDTNPSEERLRKHWDMTLEEVVALTKWFEAVAEKDGVVLGWW